MRGLVKLVLVLLVLAVVADRGADLYAEHTAARQIQTSQKLSATPQVSIAGFPFLTQFADQRYHLVSAQARDVKVGRGSTAVTLSRVRFTFRDVTSNRGFTRFRSPRASARATLGYAEVSRALGLRIRYAGSGRVSATKTLDVLGISLSVKISAEPRVAGRTLRFSGVRLEGPADVPTQIQQQLGALLTTPIPLTQLPFDVALRSLHAGADAITVTLAGRDLSYDLTKDRR